MQVVHGFGVVAAPDHPGIADPGFVLDDPTRQLHPLVQAIQQQAVSHFARALVDYVINIKWLMSSTSLFCERYERSYSI